LAIRPEDLQVIPSISAVPPPGHLMGTVEAALFVGERVEYQIHIADQATVIAYGDRHTAAGPSDVVWLKPRSTNHTAWMGA
jgi:hypothetical protein